MRALGYDTRTLKLSAFVLAGAIAGIAGALSLDTGGINIGLLLVTVLLIGGAFAFVLRKVIAARSRPYAAGEESMIGRVGVVREPLSPSGMVFVDGALWQATSASGPLPIGTPVRVVAVDGLHLRVQPLSDRQAAVSEGPPQSVSP
jgi:membrane-bound serine protease (ClpP class)